VKPMAMYGLGLRAVAAGRSDAWLLRYADGTAEPLALGRWCGSLVAGDHGLLDRCTGPTLDVGCGPGRLAAAVAWRAVRLVGQSLRPYLTSGLIISGVVSLVAFPLVAGYGRRSDNASIQPLDYSRGLLVTLAAVWSGVAVIALVRRLTSSAAGRQLVR